MHFCAFAVQNQNLIQSSLISLVALWCKILDYLEVRLPTALYIVGKTVAQVNSLTKLPLTPVHQHFSL